MVGKAVNSLCLSLFFVYNNVGILERYLFCYFLHKSQTVTQKTYMLHSNVIPLYLLHFQCLLFQDHFLSSRVVIIDKLIYFIIQMG